MQRTAWAHARTLLAPFFGLFVVVLLFAVLGWITKPDRPFLTPFRLTLIAKQSAIVGIGALGMTLVIISGGIDLAVGSLLALSSCVLATQLRDGADPTVAVALTFLVATLAGAFNGILVTFLHVAPFIATLGTMLIFRGLAERITDQQKTSAQAPEWIATLLDAPSTESYTLVCTGVWIVLIAAAIVAFVLRTTVFGRYIFAVGSNEHASLLSGVPVRRVKIAVYAIAGFCMGVAGLFEFANLNAQGNPSSGNGLELEIVAAVVIGGASLSGGRGTILGALLGALLMTTLKSGCVYAELPDPIQKIIIGALILTAVALDRLRQRGTKRTPSPSA